MMGKIRELRVNIDKMKLELFWAVVKEKELVLAALQKNNLFPLTCPSSPPPHTHAHTHTHTHTQHAQHAQKFNDLKLELEKSEAQLQKYQDKLPQKQEEAANRAQDLQDLTANRDNSTAPIDALRAERKEVETDMAAKNGERRKVMVGSSS